MKVTGQTDFGVDKSIASLTQPSESVVSVGFDDGGIILMEAQSMVKTKEICIDSTYPVVDHCWSHRSVACVTSGKNITLYDFERQKILGTLVGHLDVGLVTQSPYFA